MCPESMRPGAGRRLGAFLIVAMAALLVLRALVPAGAQVRPIYDLGSAGLALQLQRLQTIGSLMHTAAHPDDEDSAQIARVARGDGARVAYLSLNRGEGGQNIIGPELFEALGVIRTEELLQARALDGGAQYFTRTIDYGFSKTVDEAAARWGEDEVLRDMVRAIRHFRPLVITSRFSGTPADGHGHHELAGRLTPLAFHAAGDPERFPELLEEGLRPWQPLKFYVGQGFRPSPATEPTLLLPTGVYDPVLGRSYFEIAMEGRSQHKSQQMGMLELRGPQASGLRLVESLVPSPAQEKHVFDGLDTSIRAVAAVAGLPDGSLKTELGAIEDAAARALAAFDALAPQKVIPALADGLRGVRDARAALAGIPSPPEPRAEADFLLGHKEREFSRALEMAAGIIVDALAMRETVTPGDAVVVAVRAYARDPSVVRLGPVRVNVPQGWRVEATGEPEPADTGFMARFFREAPDRADHFLLQVPDDASYTQPYFLEQPREGYLFVWPQTAPKGLPFAPPLASAAMAAEIGGVRVDVERSVEYRHADPVRGELRRPLNVVPRVSVELDSQVEIVPVAAPSSRRIAVRLENHAREPQRGVVRLRLPAGWSSEPRQSPFVLEQHASTAVAFHVSPPEAPEPGDATIGAEAIAGGNTFSRSMKVIAYPHIQTHRYYVPAEVPVRVLDLAVADVTVGYIMGSGDEVPDAIRRMGLEVTMLDGEQLSAGDLSRFDTIVVGIRASQTRPDFVANHGRLLDYVREGGTLIVQYQQTDYVTRGLPPFPVEMQSRVTDERAPVTILQPEHPAFTFPNRIVPSDWDGWVQERNLYALTEFDERYVPLLETFDAGEPPQRGGQVVAEIGRGRYVYTAYSWVRQLPAGVPGAYRLFANLLSLPKAPGGEPSTGRP